MPEEKKKKALWVDEDTHHQIAIMAATRKISIKQCLKEMVEGGKGSPIEKIVVNGKEFDVSDDTKQLGGFGNIPDVLNCVGKVGETQVIDDGKIVLVKFKCLSSRFMLDKND